MWDTSGNMLEPSAAAVHQVSMLITNALVRTKECALHRQKMGCGEMKGREGEEEEKKNWIHFCLDCKRREGLLFRGGHEMLKGGMKLSGLFCCFPAPNVPVCVDTSGNKEEFSAYFLIRDIF